MTSVTTRAVAFAKLWLFSFVLAIGLLAPGLASADGQPINRILVFGTSLSDPGNAFVLSNRQHLEPSDYATLGPLLVPDSETPYAVGGNRHSNGPTWIEQLAKPIGLSASVKPAWATPPVRGAFNYAVAGTRARGVIGNDVSLEQQVTKFKTDHGAASPRDLVVIEVGSNDVADVLFQIATPGELFIAASKVGEAIEALYCAGASNFVVWNVPNFGITPAVLLQGEAAAAGATFVTGLYNNFLNERLDALKDSPPTCPTEVHHGLRIIEFDAFTQLNAVVGDPGKYGLQIVDQACIRPEPPFQCANPGRHLFWDGIHPTQAGHAIVAVEVVKTILEGPLDD